MKTVTKINKPKNNADVGERIKYLRCNLLMSQEDLANKVGRKREEITMYEKGTRCIDIYTLKDIANVFNVSTDYLLGIRDFEDANIDKIAINKLTGLSNDAINNLIAINKYRNKNIINTINYLLEQEKPLPKEFYEKPDNNILTTDQTEELSKKFKEWKSNNYKQVFTLINNYFNVQIDNEEKIYICNKALKRENELNDIYDYATLKQIITSSDIADTFLLKQIENTLEDAKKDYLIQSERNGE